jgi:hypothetical protein
MTNQESFELIEELTLLCEKVYDRIQTEDDSVEDAFKRGEFWMVAAVLEALYGDFYYLKQLAGEKSS